MKIEIIVVGKNKFTYLDEAISDYQRKMKRDAEVDIIVVKESSVTHGDSAKILKEEGERIAQHFKDGFYKIALDVAGTQYSSEDFAKKIEKIRDFEGGKIQFVIGGALGISPEVLSSVHLKLSFSSMTFTHQMIRLMLVEQIYRAFEILKGSEYHK